MAATRVILEPTGYLPLDPFGFGYRLELPTTLQPLLPQVTLSLIEMKLRISGIAQRRHVRDDFPEQRGTGGREEDLR